MRDTRLAVSEAVQRSDFEVLNPTCTGSTIYVPRMATVDDWLAESTNRMASTIAVVVEVLRSDGRLDEAIKYRAPAFLFDGTIVCYFHWNAQAFASLVFPSGARIPGEHERLLGDGVQRTMRFHSDADARAAENDLLDVVDDWIEFAAR